MRSLSRKSSDIFTIPVLLRKYSFHFYYMNLLTKSRGSDWLPPKRADTMRRERLLVVFAPRFVED